MNSWNIWEKVFAEWFLIFWWIFFSVKCVYHQGKRLLHWRQASVPCFESFHKYQNVLKESSWTKDCAAMKMWLICVIFLDIFLRYCMGWPGKLVNFYRVVVPNVRSQIFHFLLRAIHYCSWRKGELNESVEKKL